jgi:alpha-1,2-mannosyltransferase
MRYIPLVAWGGRERGGVTLFMVPAVAVTLSAASAYFFLTQASSWSVASLDSGIYRDAAKVFLAGGDVYSTKFGPPGLPFTYPPCALLAFVPLAILPSALASLLMFALSAMALVACVRWSQDYATGGRAGSWWLTLALSAGASLVVEPVRTTMGLGQVNLLLLGLVLGLDARGGPGAGLGAGLASALKVTPALLVAAQFVRGEARAFWRGVAAFLVATGVAALVAPAASRLYFGSLLWDSARPGNLDYVGNQSLRGVWERHLPLQALSVWATTSLALLIVGAWCVRRHRHDPWLSITVAAVVGLLISPVSWSHHWVWVIPCVAAGARRSWRSALFWTSLVMLVATLIEAVLWTSPVPPVWSQDLFVGSGIAFVVASAYAVPMGWQRRVPPSSHETAKHSPSNQGSGSLPTAELGNVG